MPKVGEHFIQLNDNGTIFAGYIIATFHDLEGFPMYVCQRPCDGFYFMGHFRKQIKELPKLVASTK